MENNLKDYIIEDEYGRISFAGDTEQEKKLNEYCFNLTKELNRYQDAVAEMLNYININPSSLDNKIIAAIIRKYNI